jgi:hypothetical protein
MGIWPSFFFFRPSSDPTMHTRTSVTLPFFGTFWSKKSLVLNFVWSLLEQEIKCNPQQLVILASAGSLVDVLVFQFQTSEMNDIEVSGGTVAGLRAAAAADVIIGAAAGCARRKDAAKTRCEFAMDWEERELRVRGISDLVPLVR